MSEIWLSPLDEKILAFLEQLNEWCDRDTMTTYLEVPRTTLFEHLVILIQNGRIKKQRHRLDQKGRPMKFYHAVSDL